MNGYLKWHTKPGRLTRKAIDWLGAKTLTAGQSMLRWSKGRCSLCGRRHGMDFVISFNGARCWDCVDIRSLWDVKNEPAARTNIKNALREQGGEVK